MGKMKVLFILQSEESSDDYGQYNLITRENLFEDAIDIEGEDYNLILNMLSTLNYKYYSKFGLRLNMIVVPNQEIIFPDTLNKVKELYQKILAEEEKRKKELEEKKAKSKLKREAKTIAEKQRLFEKLKKELKVD